jgi:hypothetical protein
LEKTEMAHSHDHDHDCEHDHDHDGGDFSVEQGLSGLALAFAELAFAQIDFDAFSEDPRQRQAGLLFLLGAVRTLAGWEELPPAQVEVVFNTVVMELFPWDDEEVAQVLQETFKAANSPAAELAISRGREALEATMAATNGLADLLESGVR